MSCASAKHRDHLKDITMMPRPKHLPVEIWMPIARAHEPPALPALAAYFAHKHCGPSEPLAVSISHFG